MIVILWMIYQEFNGGTDDVDDIGSVEGVRQEPSKKGQEEGGAHEICDGICRIGWGEVHELDEVNHQIACICQKCQVLQHLHHWKKNHIINFLVLELACRKCQTRVLQAFLIPLTMIDGIWSKSSHQGGDSVSRGKRKVHVWFDFSEVPEISVHAKIKEDANNLVT